MDRDEARRLESAARWVETQRKSSARVSRRNTHGAVAYVYKAIADESGGLIQVKRVNSDGTVTGDAVTLQVLP